MNPTTIKQLDEWMTLHCYNDSYGIGNRNIHEGYGLDTVGSLYVWYYTERGHKDNIRFFQTEEAAVDFAFKTITQDQSANRHLVGFIMNKSVEEEELVTALQNRNIHFWKDEIPFVSAQDKRTRIFVFGCDITKVLDLQEKYGSIN